MGNITGRPTVAASGLNAYLASNDADEQLDLSFTDSYTAAVTASNTFTITDVSTTYNFTRNAQFILTDGGITANASILVPAVKKVFAVKNTTGFDCTVAISGQADTPDTVPAGTSAMFHSDGVNVRIAGGGAGFGGSWFDLTDTDPTTFTGQAGKFVAVNSTPDGLEFVDAPSGGGAGDALPFTLSPAWRGALVVKAATESAADYSAFTKIPWDTVVRDTDSIFNNGTDELTVPAGVTKVRVSAGILVNSVVSDDFIFAGIHKNGSITFDGAGATRIERPSIQTNVEIRVETAVIDVVEGDDFDVRLQIGQNVADTSIDINAGRSWLQMEIIETTDTVPSLRTVVASLPAKVRYARISKSADQTSIGTGVVECTFDQTLVDTDSLSDLSNNALVVPAGVRKVNVRAFVQMLNAGTAGSLMTRIQVNDAPVSGAEGFVRFERGIAGSDSEIQAFTGIVDVTEGDSFTLDVQMTGDATADISTATWMEMEIVEFNSSTDAVQAYIAVPPEHKGALIAANEAGPSMTNSAYNPVTLDVAVYDTTFDPGDGGPPQRFWFGQNWTFVDGDVSVGNDEITETAHGYQTGEGPVRLSSSGTLPAGLATATNYWIIRRDANTIAFATSRANALADTDVDITAAAGGGTHTVEQDSHVVVPAGVSKVQLHAYVAFGGNTSGAVRSRIAKNDANFDGGPHIYREDFAGGEKWETNSAVVEVSEGDRLSVDVYPVTGTSTNDGTHGYPWLNINVIEESRAITYPGVTVTPPFVGAHIDFASDITALDTDPGVKIAFDNAVEDTDGFFNDANDSIEIPTGRGFIRGNLSANIRVTLADLANAGFATISKNGSNLWDGAPSVRFEPDATGDFWYANLTALGVPLADGDEFTLFVSMLGDDSVTVQNQTTWLKLEVTETDQNAFPPEPIEWFVHGAPATTDDLFMKVATRRFTVADALAGSEAYANGAPSGGAVVYDVERNGTKIGDITFADTANTATFSTVAAQQYVFDVGDRLEIVSPANVQSMTDIAFSLWGWRS